jgi:hypothetical protein
MRAKVAGAKVPVGLWKKLWKVEGHFFACDLQVLIG